MKCYKCNTKGTREEYRFLNGKYGKRPICEPHYIESLGDVDECPICKKDFYVEAGYSDNEVHEGHYEHAAHELTDTCDTCECDEPAHCPAYMESAVDSAMMTKD